jgi:Galactose binding lectin domain
VELCNVETFRPRCAGGKNDIIIILTARYGRMKFGRCIEEEPDFASMKDNPRFVGCSADVKRILDQQCSGLSECDVRVSSETFEGIKPCYAGLQMYLEASYTCIKGMLRLVHHFGSDSLHKHYKNR